VSEAQRSPRRRHGGTKEEEKKAIDEGRKPIWDEIIALSEKILAESTDDWLRHMSIKYLCSTYASMGETEKAKSYAKKMPNNAYSRNDMIVETLTGTEKRNHLQEVIAHSLFFDVLNSISHLMYTQLDDGAEPYNRDEQMALHHKVIDIINIFIEEGSFGDFNMPLMNAHYGLALLYAKKNDAAAALNHFKLAVKYAVLHDAMPAANDNSREEYSSLLLKGIKFPSITMHGPHHTIAEHLLDMSHNLDSTLPAAELEEIRRELRSNQGDAKPGDL